MREASEEARKAKFLRRVVAPHDELLKLSPTYKRLWDRLAGHADASVDEAAAD